MKHCERKAFQRNYHALVMCCGSHGVEGGLTCAAALYNTSHSIRGSMRRINSGLKSITSFVTSVACNKCEVEASLSDHVRPSHRGPTLNAFTSSAGV